MRGLNLRWCTLATVYVNHATLYSWEEVWTKVVFLKWELIKIFLPMKKWQLLLEMTTTSISKVNCTKGSNQCYCKKIVQEWINSQSWWLLGPEITTIADHCVKIRLSIDVCMSEHCSYFLFTCIIQSIR